VPASSRIEEPSAVMKALRCSRRTMSIERRLDSRCGHGLHWCGSLALARKAALVGSSGVPQKMARTECAHTRRAFAPAGLGMVNPARDSPVASRVTPGATGVVPAASSRAAGVPRGLRGVGLAWFLLALRRRLRLRWDRIRSARQILRRLRLRPNRILSRCLGHVTDLTPRRGRGKPRHRQTRPALASSASR
jgi:hypothetical protein